MGVLLIEIFVIDQLQSTYSDALKTSLVTDSKSCFTLLTLGTLFLILVRVREAHIKLIVMQ